MKKYQIILADPPWEYKAGRCLTPKSLLSGNNQVPYNYMTHENLCSLKINEIADKNCILFMWTTGPKLNKAFEVGEKWGFEYSTIGFVWEKQLTNPGYYTLSSVEICLIFRKGNIPIPRGRRDVRQFLSEQRTKHSEKPNEIRKRIELMFPIQNKLELFAREKTEGWDVFGNEVESDIDLLGETNDH